MTFPLVVHLVSDQWLGVARARMPDLYNHIWNFWYFTTGREAAAGGLFGRTDLLFFPIGAPLAFHTVNLLHVGLVSVFAPWSSWVAGFNLTGLLQLTLAGLATFLLLRDLRLDPRAAWLGGFLYALSPWSLRHLSQHPDLVSPLGLPLAMWALRRALSGGNLVGWCALGAVGLASVAYSGLYLFVLSTILVAGQMTAMFLARGALRNRRNWAVAFTMALFAAALSAPRVVPMMRVQGELEEIVAQKFEERSSVDLARFFWPFGDPLLPESLSADPGWPGPGLSMLLAPTGIVLALFGCAPGARSRECRRWLAPALFFLTLTAGWPLSIAGHAFEWWPDLRTLLARLAPVPFQAFRESKLYFPAVLLPFSACAAIGADRFLVGPGPPSRGRGRLAVLLVSAAALAWIGPFRPARLEVHPVYRELGSMSGEFALIELPFGTRLAKQYLYFQTIHGHPIQEGLVSRAPEAVLRLWRSNGALRRWWRASGPQGIGAESPPIDRESELEALKELQRVGFRYLILHAEAPAALRREFEGVPVLFEDGQLRVMALRELEARLADPSAP